MPARSVSACYWVVWAVRWPPPIQVAQQTKIAAAENSPATATPPAIRAPRANATARSASPVERIPGHAAPSAPAEVKQRRASPSPATRYRRATVGGPRATLRYTCPALRNCPPSPYRPPTLATAINQLSTVVWQQVTVFATFALPNPEPAPQPAMPSIVQQEPVVDSSGGSTQAPDPGAAQPPVLDAPPVVAAMPAVAAAPAGPATPIIANNSWMAPPQSALGTTEAAVRGSVSATSEPPAAHGITPMGTRASRLGYAEYLRNAKLLELAVVALPGVAGLLMLTVGGGVIGYRQANAGRIVRINGAASFLP